MGWGAARLRAETTPGSEHGAERRGRSRGRSRGSRRTELQEQPPGDPRRDGQRRSRAGAQGPRHPERTPTFSPDSAEPRGRIPTRSSQVTGRGGRAGDDEPEAVSWPARGKEGRRGRVVGVGSPERRKRTVEGLPLARLGLLHACRSETLVLLEEDGPARVSTIPPQHHPPAPSQRHRSRRS